METALTIVGIIVLLLCILVYSLMKSISKYSEETTESLYTLELDIQYLKDKIDSYEELMILIEDEYQVKELNGK